MPGRTSHPPDLEHVTDRAVALTVSAADSAGYRGTARGQVTVVMSWRRSGAAAKRASHAVSLVLFGSFAAAAIALGAWHLTLPALFFAIRLVAAGYAALRNRLNRSRVSIANGVLVCEEGPFPRTCRSRAAVTAVAGVDVEEEVDEKRAEPVRHVHVRLRCGHGFVLLRDVGRAAHAARCADAIAEALRGAGAA